MTHIATLVQSIEKPKPADIFALLEMPVDKSAFEVDVDAQGIFHVVGPMIDNLTRGVFLDDTESARYFHKRLEKSGVIDELKKLGLSDGDTVQIGGTQFDWQE
jgi:GTP-binding protein